MLSTSFEWRNPLVILGAGGGRRLGDQGGGQPKLLLPLATGSLAPRTVLDVILEAWLPRASEVFVVAAEPTEPLVSALARYAVSSSVVVQPSPDGTLNALMLLADRLPDRFTVLLGDCLMQGHLQGPPEPFCGLGVWEDADSAAVRANYAVGVAGDKILSVREKPDRVTDELCGMGVYFLDGPFLDAVRELPVDGQGQREMTDGLGFYLAQGGPLGVARLRGHYVNVNTPADLGQARRRFGPR
jgi:dTDP-glucose pyrophosphorylase